MKLSKRAIGLSPSPLQTFFAQAKKITEGLAQKTEIISLNIGDPAFDLPFHIPGAAVKYINRNPHIGYTPAAGVEQLRQLCKQDFLKDGLKGKVLVSAGSKPLIAAAIWALVDTGDEVLVPSPYYPPFKELVSTYGGVPILVDTTENDFRLKLAEHYLTNSTKGIILNYPNNPTGVVWTLQELKKIAEIVQERNLWVLSDEAYIRLAYDNVLIKSFASFKNMAKRVITVRSFSKTYTMTGWRVGYAIGPEKTMNKIESYLGMAVGSPSTVGQEAAIAAMKNPWQDWESIINVLEKRRDFILSWLAKHGIPYAKPQGAFYVFADFSSFMNAEIKGSVDLATYLLKNAGIATTPGIAFGPYDSWLRISYALESVDRIEEGIKRISKLFRF